MVVSTRYCPACGSANGSQAAFCSACGQALSTNTQSRTGLLIPNHLLKGRYRILAQVGRGGFGAVYRAEDVQLGNRLVAIKEMSQYGFAPQELQQAVDAFQHEALMLAGLRHSNLPRIYEQFAEIGRQYLVMDFIEGQTLETYLAQRGGSLPVAEALQIGLQLCNVLDYLHSRQPPIIFRDLKPENVMISQDGQLSLIDFGIARHFKPGQSRDTVAFGSPGYAAPEQYGKAQTTPRSDLYSLGAMLHHLLSGNDPSNSPFRFAPLQLSGPAGLEALIVQMVEINEDKRPESASIVKQELQRLIDMLPAQQRSARSSAAKQSMLAAASQSLSKPKMPAPVYHVLAEPVIVAPPAPPVVEVRPHLTYIHHDDWVWSVAWSPDGKHITSASRDKTVQVWDAKTLQPLSIYRRHAHEVFTCTWSPAGTKIASAGAGKTVQVWDVATTNHLFTYRKHTGAIQEIAWSPDGSYIASVSRDATLQVIDALSGKHRFSYPGSWGMLAVAWSPDGKRVASAGLDKTVQVWEPTGPEAPLITYRGHIGAVRSVAWSPDGTQIASAGLDKMVHVWKPEG